MPHILIDARELRTSSGRYVERLLHYLQQLDQQDDHPNSLPDDQQLDQDRVQGRSQDQTRRRYTVLLKPQDMEGWQPTNPNFTKVSCPHKEFTFAEQLGLRRQIAGLRPDLVHFAFPQQPIWYRGRTVTTLHDLTTLRFRNPAKNPLVFGFKQRVYGYVVRRAAQKAAHLLVPSQFVKDDVARYAGIDPGKITVTYEAADKITAQPELLPELLDKQFIMYVGRPTPHKNLERLIDAFQILQARQPELQLVLAGRQDANYRRIAEHVQKANIRGVVFSGYIHDGQLRWLYENCTAYVFPSLSEGFGLPGLEAMAHGAPVISSRATCLPEIYGKAAHYFDPQDVQDMTNATYDALTDKTMRQELIAAGKIQVQKYSWRRMAEQTLAIYNSALR